MTRTPSATSLLRAAPPIAWLPLFLLGALAVYGNIVGSLFSSDDFGVLFHAAKSGLAVIRTPFAGVFFRPFVWATWVLDYELWGLNATGFHLTNILLHGANSWLVFLLGLHIFGGNRRRAFLAAAAGAVFLVAPSHGEAVSWVSGRCDVLAALFGLASLVLFFRFKEANRPAALGGSVALFFCGLLAKESALVVPALILASVLLDTRQTLGPLSRVAKSWQDLWPYLACLAPYLLLRYAILGQLVGGYGASVHLRFTPKVLVSNLLLYPARTALPALESVIGAPFVLPLPVWLSIGALVVGLALLSLIFERERRSHSGLSWLLAAYVLSLAPVLNLGVSPYDTQGERFLYFASAFFCLAFPLVFAELLRDRAAVLGVAVAVLVVWSASLWRVDRHWREAGTVAREIVSEIDDLGTGGSLFVLVVPDNIRGAYVFRQGLREAVMLFCHRLRVSGGVLVATCAQMAPEDVVAVELGGERFSVRQVTANGGFTRADQASSGFPGGSYAIDEFSPQQFTVSLTRPSEDDRVVYFSAGRLRVLR